MQNENSQCCNQENSIVKKWFLSENVEDLQEILDSGFDINTTDEKGNTAIFDAGMEKSLFLIKKGINLVIKNQNFDNALSYTYGKRNVEKIRLISDYMNESELAFNVNTAREIGTKMKMSGIFLQLLSFSNFKVHEQESETSFEEYLRLKHVDDGLYHLFVSIREAKRINSVIKSDLDNYSKKSKRL